MKIKKMKKFILSLGLIAMAFNLTNCVKNEEAAPSVDVKGDFALYASVSRTANDGLNTVWSTGDDLGVFHAVTDGTTYTKDGQFKLEDVTTGCFLGNVNGTLDPEEEYDWYAMYPYSSYVPGPANTGSGYMTIGCAASGTQTQTGNNSLAHVAGKNFPLVGKAYAVSANSAPALAMTHVATLLEFEVTNSLDEAITVSSIQFTAPAALVGTFYIDFTDTANIEAESSGTSYTSKSATLIVKNGEAIAAGASAKFYLPVAPFTAAANAKLSIEVNVTSGEKVGALVKEITLAAETSFKAGKIKPIKVNYDAEFVEEGYALPFSDDFAWVKKDESNGVLAVSDLSDNYATCSTIYGSVGELKFGKSGEDGSLTTKPFNLSQPFTVVVDAYEWASKNATLKITVNGVSKTAELTQEYVKYKFEFDAATAASSVKIDVVGERGYIDNLEIVSGHDYVLPPVIKVTDSGVAVEHEGGVATVSYSIMNAVEGAALTASANVDWITNIDCSVDGKVSFNVAANEVEESRKGNLTFSYVGAADLVIAVSQAAKPSEGGGNTPTDASLSFANKAQRTEYSTSKQVWEQNGIVFTNNKASSTSNVGDYANPARLYASSSVEITAPGQISKVVYVANSSSYATALKNSIGTVTGGSVAVSGSNVTVTYTTPVDKVTIAKLTAQVRINSLTVTYLK